MARFNLADYLDEIRAIAKNKKCTPTEAVDLMIINLNTFNEYNKGTGNFNYRGLGQEWGMLPSADKVAQKQEVKRLVSTTTHARRRR